MIENCNNYKADIQKLGEENQKKISELNQLNDAKLEQAKLESNKVEQKLSDEIADLRSSCQQKSAEYEELTNRLNAKKCEYGELNERMAEREKDLKNMKTTIEEKLAEVEQRNNEVTFVFSQLKLNLVSLSEFQRNRKSLLVVL